jgi:N-carbamoyl-L-amino-acid hydrolase
MDIMSTSDLRIDIDRLSARLAELARIGGLDGGGVCRLALTAEDKAGRDRVVSWMQELGMSVTVDGIGNVWAVRAGELDGPPVVVGSHIDTVRTGGPYDGNLGVLAGLELIATLNDAGVTTRHPLAVAFFTNEEGSRFAPDMMGSGVNQGALELAECLATVGIDGRSVAECLDEIGYRGDASARLDAHAFLELHIEQGPVLDREGITIGAVTGVQGISWTEVVLQGVSNHAGTTPMSMRHDAGLAAARINVFLRELALELGHPQVATVGHMELGPNLVNVVPRRALLTLDLRNTDETVLRGAEERAFAFVKDAASAEGLGVEMSSLARFEPVDFDAGIVDEVEATASRLGHSVRRMPSGAGHDAQMFAPNCPSGMIFVPSVDGISHNIREHTESKDIEAGANVLLQVVLSRSGA